MTDDILEGIDLLSNMVSLDSSINKGELKITETYNFSDIEESPHAIAGEIEGEAAIAGVTENSDFHVDVNGQTLEVCTRASFDENEKAIVEQMYSVCTSMLLMVSTHNDQMAINMANGLIMQVADSVEKYPINEGAEQ